MVLRIAIRKISIVSLEIALIISGKISRLLDRTTTGGLYLINWRKFLKQVIAGQNINLIPLLLYQIFSSLLLRMEKITLMKISGRVKLLTWLPGRTAGIPVSGGRYLEGVVEDGLIMKLCIS